MNCTSENSSAAVAVAVVGGGLAGLARGGGRRAWLPRGTVRADGLARRPRRLVPRRADRATRRHVPTRGDGLLHQPDRLLRPSGRVRLLPACPTLHFFGPDGTRSDFAATGWLPAPLHLLPAMLRQRHLTLGERWQAMRGLARLARFRLTENQPEETIGAWLGRAGQSPRVVARFWTPIILGGLGETPERASLRAARKVFVDGFWPRGTPTRCCCPE